MPSVTLSLQILLVLSRSESVAQTLRPNSPTAGPPQKYTQGIHVGTPRT